MKKYLLSDKGKFYKANLHVHTTVSDGRMTPEEIKKVYMEKGYSIVAFTDHEVMVPQAHLTDDSFLAITSTEISTNLKTDCDFCYSKTYHLNIYSPEEKKNCFNTFDKPKMWLDHSYDYITDEQEKTQYKRVYTAECINDVIRKANEEGCLVSYNHPVWSLQDYSDYIGLKGLWGIEVYNTGCYRNGYFDSEKPLDDLLRVGERVFPLATDDAHRIEDCFGGFVMVSSDELTYEKIFKSLKDGDFYASTGPEIFEISIEEGKVNVKCSPASTVCITTDCRHLYSKRSENGDLSDVTFDIYGYLRLTSDCINEHRYIRVTVVDKTGNSAYSRAYFADELAD